MKNIILKIDDKDFFILLEEKTQMRKRGGYLFRFTWEDFFMELFKEHVRRKKAK